MYRQTLKNIIGGGGGLSGYANGWQCQGIRYHDLGNHSAREARGKFKDVSVFSSVFMLN